MGRPLPYVPMHPPTTPVSYSRMQEILQKNVACKVEVKAVQVAEPTASGPAVTAGSIEWDRPEPKSRLLYSKCRRFRVRKWSGTEAVKEPPDWKYQAELLVENLWYYAFGRIRDSFADSAQDCAAFLEKERK